MEPEPLLDSLRNAVTAMPDDVPLRLHLATMLLRAGQRDEAVRHLGAVLQREPGNAEAMRMLTAPAEVAGPPADVENPPGRVTDSVPPSPAQAPETPAGPADPPAAGPAPAPAEAGTAPDPGSGDPTEGYDWSQAEDELRDVLPAMFVGEPGPPRPGSTRPAPTTPSTPGSPWPT